MMFRAIGRSRWAVIASVFFTLMFAGAITHPVAATPGDSQGQAKGQAKGQADEHAAGSAAAGGNSDGTPKPRSDAPGDHGQADAPRERGTASTAEPLTSPQPLSRADQNTGGANGSCPDAGAYCSTRDESPSMNGLGEEQPPGRPCAGCVGKADNKNPPGQAPDASDPFAGYECDSNQGVGQSNPAHTGCEEAGDDEVTGTSTDAEGGTDEAAKDTEPECVGAGTGCTAGAEAAGQPAEVNTQQPNVVLGVEKERSQVNRATPLLQPQAAVLPNTGASDGLALFGAGGLALALAGATTLLIQRRRVLRR
jgi:LPXTG-motif cell wall-anchored protein